jgi:hypothetical protein
MHNLTKQKINLIFHFILSLKNFEAKEIVINAFF